MAALSLRIHLVDKNVTKTMQFHPGTTTFDACRIIREKNSEANVGQAKDYGLFLSAEDTKKGVWLEPARALEYYMLRDTNVLEYMRKLRTLRVRMLDGTIKTLMVDDSQPVANLMVVICTKIGITNHDEYSLVRENIEDELENKPNFGTLTLRRKKEEKERDAKMEQLKKKIKTEDEVNWIDPSKTLREQGIDETETVLLRRKFFFSDQNIDSRDPVQLNLLYVQARDAILDGTHPVTQEKACEFAGIQCQIQYGDHVETKHRPGFLDLRELLPQSYVKVKGMEKKIFAEHKKQQGRSELDSKVLYTQTARNLKTYGVAFFLVKEKMKGKNKLAPRLLGVTKDSVLRLDEKTKEILKTWPLTTVKRWGASPNTFTLDFGDYSDEYYSVQTTEAEQIQQLIAGYIDIILKKKQSKDHCGIEGDEGSTMVEDSVCPSKATILQHERSVKVGKVNTESLAKPAIMRAGADGAQPYGTGHMGAAQYTTVSGQVHLSHAPPTVQQTKVSNVLSEPQRALLSTISAGHEIIVTAEKELVTKVTIPRLGSDPASLKWKETTLDTNKQNVSSQIAAMNAATAQVVTLTSGSEEVDHTAVGAAITTIASNLPEMTKGVRMIAALMDDNGSGDKLLDAARKLCNAFSDLLKAAEPEAKEPRQSLLNAASRVGEASHHVLSTIGEENDDNREIQDMLLGLAKAVANTTAALVLKAKNIAATCDDPNVQNKVIGAATQCALATSQLVACSKVVAPTLHSPACQQQLIVAIKEVTRSVEELDQICNDACSDEQKLRELSQAAAEVTRTLDHLLNHIRNATRVRVHETVQESAVQTILSSTDKLLASSEDSGEMVRQARVLGKATAELIQAIKGEAENETDSEMQRKLLAAAKVLADATAKMVEAARQCASHPHDTQRQDSLRRAVEDLRLATTHAATPAYRRSVLNHLENAAKEAANSSIQFMSAAQSAGHSNQSRSSQDELLTDCRALADAVPRLAESVKGTIAQPENPTAQANLLKATEQFLQPGNRAVQSSRAVLPTVSDQASAKLLSSSSQQLATSMNDLRAALGQARDVFGDSDIESLTAISEIIHSLKDELAAFNRAAQMNDLRPLPGETPEHAALKLASSCKTLRSAMAQLQTAAAQQNESYTIQAAHETANGLSDLTLAVRGIAATTQDRQLQSKVIHNADNVMDRALTLVGEARSALISPESAKNLIYATKEVTSALNDCVNCLPGQKDIDEAINTIEDASQILTMNEFPYSNKPYGQLQQELNNAAIVFNKSSTEVASSTRNAMTLAQSSKGFGTAFNDLLGVSMEMAGQTQDTELRSHIVMSLKNISTVSSTLLTTAKHVTTNPNIPNAKNQLTAAARAVTDSINYLVDVCTNAAPGQKECDNAVRNIQSMRPLLDNTTEPINDSSYFECLDTVMTKSKSLGDGMTGIANHAKRCEHEQFGEAVKGVAVSICGLVESAGQASYLVGVSDSRSVAGRPGLLDQAQLARAQQAIQTACQELVSPISNKQKVLFAATEIAKHTSALCNACRLASSKTTHPVAKREFVKFAKDVANSTANLVKEIKTLDQDYNDRNRQSTEEATKPLLDAVESLGLYASCNPDLASIPAMISPEARSSQRPIISAGHSIIDGSCAMIDAAKSLAVSPKDPPKWQLLANHSKSVSDSIKNLVSSIRDKAPGQNECKDVINELDQLTKDLSDASLLACNQNLSQRRENTLQGFSDTVQTSVNEISDRLDPLKHAAKYQAENVGHTVKNFAQYFKPLVHSAIGAASNMINSQPQMTLLDQTKTLVECATQLIIFTKEGGGNPKAINIHGDIEESCEATRDALQDMNLTLEKLANQAGVINGQLETITRALARVTDNRSSTMAMDSVHSFVDYQTRMVAASKEIARLSQDMVTKSTSDVQRIGKLSSELSKTYAQLANDSVGAASSTNNADVSQRIRSGIQLLGNACIEIVKAGNNCQVAPLGDTYSQRDLSEAAKHVSERVSQVLAALQAGSRGTQACINAASTVSGIIGDLDTTIMFATAGTLHAEKENETFADHRENILKTAKALVEDTKTLVAGAASSQEQLAVAAQNAVSTIVQLAEVVKFGAASLGSNNPEAQVMLINAVKDVATALGDLIHATKSASGKGIDHPSMNHLKDSAKIMVTNVTSLLKTVKAVEDEHTRGTRALEATIEAIAQEIRALQSPEQFKSSAGPEDLVRCTKSITTATARAVAAGNSGKQDDAIVAANVGRKAISDMLSICKGVANNAETQDLRLRTLQSGQDVAVQYRELLQAILCILSKPGQQDNKAQLPIISRKIAQCVTELVTSAQLLKGTDWVDPEDPTVIAENELLGAAASIDAAAKKLACLRPRRSVQETDESLNFDEMILEAAKSIAAATSALVKAASAAQRELIDLGKVSRRPLTSSDDGQWSEGLISAARLVAAATHSLVESANELVQGLSSEEKLVSSAKQVASSTAQLLVACKVKADPDADSTKRLQSAGNAVKRATDNLVRAAQQAIKEEEERSFVLNKRMVGGIAQEIDARSEVFRIERQLEEARGRLTAIRQAKYKIKGAESDVETDGYQSGYESLSARFETRSADGSPAFGQNSFQQKSFSSLKSPEKVSDADNIQLRKSPYNPEVETVIIQPSKSPNIYGKLSPTSPGKKVAGFSSFGKFDLNKSNPEYLSGYGQESTFKTFSDEKNESYSSVSSFGNNQDFSQGTNFNGVAQSSHMSTVSTHKTVENHTFKTRTSQQKLGTFQ